jgi:hypothetical protein
MLGGTVAFAHGVDLAEASFFGQGGGGRGDRAEHGGGCGQGDQATEHGVLLQMRAAE